MLENFAGRPTSEDALVASIRAAAPGYAAGLKARYAARLAASHRLVFACPGTIEVAAEEIALALRVTKIEAERLIAVGRAVTGPFFATGEALDAGTVTFPKAWVIADCLSEIPLEVALPVETKALERAPAQTAQSCGRTSNGCSSRPTRTTPMTGPPRRSSGGPWAGPPRQDGMARMSLFLPAPDALTLDGALDSAATAARRRGHPHGRATARRHPGRLGRHRLRTGRP